MQREYFKQKLNGAFGVHPVVALLGPRQCGKTTLAQDYVSGYRHAVTTFDLEYDPDLARLADPVLALERLSGLIVLDEVQRRPELFPTLRAIVDKNRDRQKYLILGSASRELIRQSSESLAGRIEYIELTPFFYRETKELENLWLRGGFPLSYLADDIEDSSRWRKAYIKTFLEKDIPGLGFNIPATTLRRFWMMLAHYHGNLFNASELGRSLGVSHTTINHYLDIIVSTFMVRRLQPWFSNISKRQVKTPKIYFRDSGILHSLLEIDTLEGLNNHPKVGASWEGFALEEVIRCHQADPENCFFWATHNGAELDLFINQKKKFGFEFKYSSTPKVTKSMHIAMEALELDKLFVIVPGNVDFPLSREIRAIGLKNYLDSKSCA